MNNAATDLAFDFSWTMREDSDHYSFYKRNLPVLMLHSGLHSDYHRPSDDVEKLDFAGMEQIVRMLFGVVHDLANGPELLGFRAVSRSENSGARREREQPLPALPGRFGLAWDPRDEGRDGGLRVLQVTPRSPAAIFGVRVGDRLVRFAGRDLSAGSDLRSLVLAAKSPVVVTVERAGSAEPLNLTVRLFGPPTRLGITWRLDAAEPQAVIVGRVVPGSPAARSGIQVNDRLYEVSGKSFTGEQEFRRLLTETDSDTLELLTERDGRVRTIAVKLLPAPNNEF
jgi:membrane-associated protease RseP (regulator of RpoE activity)